MEINKVNEITLALSGYLDEYRKLPQILGMLKWQHIECSEREFADYVEAYRQQDNEYYLESCSNGYRFTRDADAIKKSCNQRIGKAISMLNNAKRDLSRLGERNQLTLIDNFINDYQAQIKVVEGMD